VAGRQPRFVLSPVVEEERRQQIDCTKMLRQVLRPGVAWTAIDHSHSFNPTIGRNGRPIGLIEMQLRKARGVRAGIPDYLFWHRSLSYAIEFKIDDNGLSDAQEIFIGELLGADVFCKVCWGATQVMNTVFAWGLCRPQIHWEHAA
jgi:VRR-NUC domain-containing protein